MKVFDKLTAEVEKVLEIGIGTGPNMRYYAARNINVTVLGLDPNLKMKKLARKSATKAGLKSKHFRFKQGVSFSYRSVCILHPCLFHSPMMLVLC